MGNESNSKEQQERAALAARAQTRLALMARGKRQQLAKTIPLPGMFDPATGLQVFAQLAVLTCTELRECHAHAVLELERLGLDPNARVNAQPLEDEAVVQVLLRCLREQDNVEARFALDAADVRDNFTADERAATYELYFDYQQMIDPAPERMTPELVAMIGEAIKKKDGIRLRDCGSTMLASYLLATASPPSS